MKLFRFTGGIHPEGRKEATEKLPIRRLPLPERLYVPMQQHIGLPAEPVVRMGQRVLKGELLGRANGPLSAAIHAPTSGRVLNIGHTTAPHPSGLPVSAVIIEPDGEESWMEYPVPRDPLAMPPELIAERVAAAGIVGMGGATFPTAVKLAGASGRHIHTLIVNGGECEPYLTCDDRLMRERAAEVIDGVSIMLRVIRWGQAIVAVEANKPEALAAMEEAARGHGNIRVVEVPTRYPTGSEKQLIKLLTGREVPAGGLTSQAGAIVHNVSTCYAVSQAVRLGRPLVSRIVTVSGGAIRFPGNLEVAIGTPVEHLIAACGGLTEPPARLLMGGPMMGIPLPSAEVPIVKGSSGILALTGAESAPVGAASPCIRCARCVDACPMGLLPLEMAARTRRGDVGGAAEYGLKECILCGSCAFVCPARIPLVNYFHYGKGELAWREQARAKADETRRLAQARTARLEREARAKAEAAARRKAERAARTAQEEQVS